MAGMEWQQIAEFAIYLIVAGAFSGFLAGLFGIGGGTVLVPAFYQVFGAVGIDDAVRIQLSVGSSLALVAATSWRSLAAHRKRGIVDEELLRSFRISVPFGVLIATLLLSSISSYGLRAIFAAVCFAIAAKLLFGRDSWRLGTDIPQNPIRGIVGTIIGFLSTLMGIGGGVLNNTFMTSYGRPIHKAVATSAGVGLLIAIPGVIGYVWAGWQKAGLPLLSTGYVNWLAVTLVLPLSLYVTPMGVKVAHALPKRQLEASLGLYLLSVAVRFIWTLV